MAAKRAVAKAVEVVEVSESERIAQAIELHFASATVITAVELADIIDIDAKQLRAKLRSNKFRDQSSERNNAWKLDKTQAAQAVALCVKTKASKASE